MPPTDLTSEVHARMTAHRLESSKIREVANAGAGLSGVIPLWFGEPDIVTPEFICAAAKQALDDGRTFYGPNLGISSLREAIAAYLKRYGRRADSTRVCVTASGVHAIMLCAQALLDPGDRVVVPTPHWPHLAEIPRILGAETELVPLRLEDGLWKADLEELISAIVPGTKLVIVNSPSNPTGWTLTSDEQRALLEHCRRLGVWILADEVYERMFFEGDAAPSFLDIADPNDRVLAVNSFSKSWAMTGWRLGWVVAPGSLIDTFAKLNEYNISSATTFVQEAGLAAIQGGDSFVEATVARYRDMRDLTINLLGDNPRISMPLPRGAIYVFFGVDGVRDSLSFAKDLLVRARVGLAPGSAFGPAGEGYMRLCFAGSRERLTEACHRVTEFMRTAGRY
jgi:aspartate/methionine/tyrosine aminotransferase